VQMKCVKCHGAFDAADTRRRVCEGCAALGKVTARRRFTRLVKLGDGEARASSLESLYSLALKSQDEVAAALGVTRQFVSYTERRAVLKLRCHVREEAEEADVRDVRGQGSGVKGEKVSGGRERVLVSLQKYDRQIMRWGRLLRRMFLANCCHQECRDLILAIEQGRRALECARMEMQND